MAGAVQAERVARWKDSSWSALGSGLSVTVEALAGGDLGDGPMLFAGGTFDTSAGGDSFLARWGLPEDLDPPTLACPSSVVVIDAWGSPSGETVSFPVTASDCRDPAPAVVCVPPSGSFFPRGTTWITCTATDASGNQSTCRFPVIVTLEKVRPR
jgi:hypothetical protein